MTREEFDALSPKGLREYIKWASPGCGSVIRAKALLEIHEALDESTQNEFYDEVKRILGRDK